MIKGSLKEDAMTMKKSWLLALSTMMLLSCAAGGQSASSSNPSSPSQGTSETSGDTTPLVPSTPADSTPEDSSSEASAPSSSTSSSETSASSSSSSSSSAPTDVPVGDATIDFTYKGADNTAVTSSAKLFTASGIEVSSFAPENVYGLGKETAGIRLAMSKKAGTLTFNLASSLSIRRMIIDAEAYGNDENPTLTVNIGNDAFKQTINERDEYAYDIGLLDTASFSLFAAAKKRVQVYKITFEIGELVPVYPTSISLNNTEKSLAKGSSFSLSVNYLPANTNQKNVTFASSEPTIATVDSNGRVKGVSNGEATITATAKTESGTTSATCKVTVYTPESGTLEATKMAYTYSDVQANNVYDLDNAPSLDEGKLLVIPVWFTDSSNYIAASKKETVREDIRKAYFGTTKDTGWHSVKSFYEEESKGRLSLEGTVSNWYEPGKAVSAFRSVRDGGDATVELVNEAADWYFTQNPSESRKDYDRDGNGYLDGVMLIYAAPDYSSLGKDSDSEYNQYGNLWAYCYWVQDEEEKDLNNPGANVFFWASYDFMYDSSTASSRTGKSSYGLGNNSHMDPDAHTFIHEMGHVFGLDDYYDYGPNAYSPAAGFSMQDFNIGGHDAFSTVALGWADPYIPTDSIMLEIGAFQTTHETILLTPEWNSVDSPFDEYLLLELFTPTGLNELDCTYAYDAPRYPKGPSATGVRLWHVDARLHAANELRNQSIVYNVKNLTSDPTAGKYGVEQIFTNTFGDEDYSTSLGSKYDKYDLLHLIHADKKMGLRGDDFLSESSLFLDGSSFSMEDYAKQFPDAGKLDSGKDLLWSFTVSISGSGASAKAAITLTRE